MCTLCLYLFFFFSFSFVLFLFFFVFFFFKQKTAYEIYQCDWSSDVCSSDLVFLQHFHTIVRGGIIKQDNFEILECLVEDAVQPSRQIPLMVIVGNDDRDRGLFLSHHAAFGQNMEGGLLKSEPGQQLLPGLNAQIPLQVFILHEGRDLLRHGLHVLIGNHKTGDRKSTRLNSSHTDISRMPSSA